MDQIGNMYCTWTKRQTNETNENVFFPAIYISVTDIRSGDGAFDMQQFD